jgi:hypothetical protein
MMGDPAMNVLRGCCVLLGLSVLAVGSRPGAAVSNPATLEMSSPDSSGILMQLHRARTDPGGGVADSLLARLLGRRYELGLPYAFAYFGAGSDSGWCVVLENGGSQTQLRAERSLYLVVMEAAADEATTRRGAVATLEAFGNHQGGGESIIPKLLGVLTKGGGDVSSQKELGDSTKELPLEFLATTGDTTLWWADQKFPLGENASYRLSVVNRRLSSKDARPTSDPKPPDLAKVVARAQVARFANGSSSRFGASLGTTWTFARKHEAEFTRPVVDPALFFHLFLVPESIPSLPGSGRVINRPSIALTGAAKIGDKPFETLFFGFSAGHLKGQVGLDVGASLRVQKSSQSGAEIWRGRFATGVHYGL